MPTPAAPTPAVVPPGGRVVVLVSGGGSNLAALLTAHADPAYGARVVGVVSDRPTAGGLDIARDAGVATAVVAPADFPDREAWDRAVARTVASFEPAWVVLAGFMRLLGAPVLDRWGGRVVNTHPALSPSFPGAHGVRDALAHGVRVTGCTVHLVDSGVDTGPIIAQRAVEVADDDDEATLHERIKVEERRLLVDVVGRAAREGLLVDGRRVRFGRG
ncbi:phosphoribosylglycinamide formyltransferase [Cellulomonas carbonis]|uniref:Phosphoribosylglycinamide formyltransferase n=1 Tax=Cellulomonas carbonis T26 TaxID=947969 RepID=A0A0A0BQ96_9CELL|nr:phosphoribosylglycinamide formyltransferase [Cellulomonas carbonis]KGM09822.1 phosphoribosylglycinamide formyltransferase [Cellulomonas carbonis T26]GGC17009.1 phosphoribosylglycinamide formyltransferase [Cellulomonas carbonis]